MKRVIAAIGAAGLILAVLWYRRPAETPTGPVAASDTPQACIDRLFDAAQEGNVTAYLECFADPELARVKREVAGTQRESFGQSLMEATRSLKGLAVMQSGGQSDTAGDQAELVVDRVYEHHHEQQTYRLARQNGWWRITEVLRAESQQPLVPYGTPVFALPEERSDESPSSSGE